MVGGRQDHRRAVVERAKELVRGRRDDGAALDRDTIGRLLPPLPQAGEGEGLIVLERDAPRHFAARGCLPLVEAARRHEVAARLEGGPEGRLLGDPLGAR